MAVRWGNDTRHSLRAAIKYNVRLLLTILEKVQFPRFFRQMTYYLKLSLDLLIRKTIAITIESIIDSVIHDKSDVFLGLIAWMLKYNLLVCKLIPPIRLASECFPIFQVALNSLLHYRRYRYCIIYYRKLFCIVK